MESANENNSNPEEKKPEQEQEEKIVHEVITCKKLEPINHTEINNDEVIKEKKKKEYKNKEEHLEEIKESNGDIKNQNQKKENKLKEDYKLETAKMFEDTLSKMISTWENEKNMFGYYYHKELYNFLFGIFHYPCIIAFQETIAHSFNFLCNYFSFCTDKLNELPVDPLFLVIWFFSEKMNLFSLYPKFNFMDEFDEKCELIGDNFFYYLLQNIKPGMEIENPQLGYSHNCMLKYLLEYSLQIGFFDNFINVFLERDDILPYSYIRFTDYVFNVLNYCEEKFLEKHNYKYNFDIVRNLTKKLNYFSQNADNYLKESNDSKKNFINLIKHLEQQYYSIIFGSLGKALEVYQKNGQDNLVDDFIFSIYSLIELLLRQQKLELRIISINFLNDLSNKYKLYFDDLKKYYSSPKSVYEYTKIKFISFLKKLNIFEIIFGENIHEALIERCNDILEFLYNNKLFTKEQISFLWKISKTKSQSINNSIINLLGKILPEFSNEDCEIVLKEIANIPLKEVNDITLKLFENFFLSENRYEILLNILFKYSNELSFYEGLTADIINKSRNILVKLLFNNNYKEDLIHCMKNCIFCLNNNYLINTHRNIFVEIMNEFIKNEKEDNIREIFKLFHENVHDFKSLITFLDTKFLVFSIFMKDLIFTKKFLIFLVEEGIRIKKKFDENNKNFKYEDLFDIDKTKKIFLNKIITDEDIESNINIIQETNFNNNKENEIKLNNDLLPKTAKDIENYYEQIIKEFFDYLKKEILKKDIILDEKEMIYDVFTKFEFSYEKNTYQKILSKTIDNIFSFHEFGNLCINQNLINFLYEFLVSNCLYEKEKETFFNFIKNILVYQFNNYALRLLSEETIDDLCLKKIPSNEIISLPYAAYESMNLYMVYKNEKNGNISYDHNENKYLKIRKIKLLIGFRTLLDFYINNDNISIAINALDTLTNIVEVASSDMINRKYILEQLFILLDKYKIKKEEKPTPLRRIFRLISIVNKTKVTENLYDINDPNNILKININNDFYNNNTQDNIEEFHAFKGLTVKEFKEEIIDNLLCRVPNDLYNYNYYNNNPHNHCTSLIELKNEIKTQELIVLYYNDKILKNEFTLAEYGINDGEIILLLNRGSIGLSLDNNYSLTEQQLKEGKEQIKIVFGDKFSEELIKEALSKYKGDIENTIIFLTNEKNVESLDEEIQKKKEENPQKKEEMFCLEEKQFNLLLDILGEGDNQLSDTIWDLFSEIKFQDDFINNSIGNEFDKIFEEKNLNKFILILKIINSVIFGDTSFCKSNKISKEIKNKWIIKFITNNELIKQILIFLSKPKNETVSNNNYLDIINIFLNYFKKIFSQIVELIKKNSINNTSENDKKETIEIYEFNVEEKDMNIFLDILSKNNFIINIYKIFSNITELSKFQYNLLKKTILNNIFDITLDYLEIIPKDVEQLLNEEKESKSLLTVLILGKEVEERKLTLDFLKRLIIEHNTKNIIENNIDIQSSIIKFYYPYLISEEVYYEQFYELYDYLFNLKQIDPKIINIQEIISKIFQHIHLFYSDYKSANITKENLNKNKNKIKYNLYILSCFSPFYDDLIKNEIDFKLTENKDIIMILYDCLFNIQKIDENIINYIFIEDKLRENAFHLLSNIISLDKKYFDVIWPKVINHHTNIIIKEKDLPLSKPLRDFNVNKYIGLKNFGATCYLNSLFQQIFMIPTFYSDIFKFNIYEKIDELKNLDECTIYKMQLTFLNLKKSIMWAYPPISFIHSFKSAFNGEPIKIGVQQDTDEFLSILCDKLEKEAKIFGKENFLENSFKGKITNEIVSLEEEYPYYSQSEEPFYSITLDIKNHKNLEEALDAYVKGEILEGENKFFVDKYKKKISIKKRNSLKKIGNQIIIHLKRFEFDFYTFENNKLNDYLKFPKNLNLKKWTRAYIRTNEINDLKEDNISLEEKDNLKDEKMEYELTGILIHSGSSLQSGHYYSLIKSQEDNKWYKFNDSEISEYDIDNNLEKECFGNLESNPNQYGKGAYLLFYTKKECAKRFKDNNDKVIIDEKIIKEIENENISFLKIRTFSNDLYHKFFMKFMNKAITYLSSPSKENNNNLDLNSLISGDINNKILITEKTIAYFKENNIDINDSKTWPENIVDIYKKVKDEFSLSNKNNIKNNVEMNFENLINLFCFYFFGIVLQYNVDKEEQIKDCMKFLNDIIKLNSILSINIMKIIESYNKIIIDFLFKYNYVDKRKENLIKDLTNFFSILFNCNYNFEYSKNKLYNGETYNYFILDGNEQLKVEKSYKSLYLRVFKIIFCDNLETIKGESKLFLSLFENFTSNNSLSSIVSSNYLLTLVSLITDNKIGELSNNNIKNVNLSNDTRKLCIKIFCDIILNCATPPMLFLKKESPYLNLKLDDISQYPKLPLNIEKIYCQDFIIFYLLNGGNENYLEKALCHLCWEDELVSNRIMSIINSFLKSNYYQYPFIENVYFNSITVFNLNDSYTNKRLETLYELEDDSDKTLIKFYYDNKYKNYGIVVEALFLISKTIEKFENVFEYFKKNKKKLEWIKEYYVEFFEGKFNLSFLNSIHPEALSFIETQIINRLEI